jgi:hypothetical protein
MIDAVFRGVAGDILAKTRYAKGNVRPEVSLTASNRPAHLR